MGNPMGNGVTISSDFTADDELRLLDKLAGKVRGHEFNAGVFLGESNQVVNAVTSAARNLSLTARHLKRGDLGAALRSLPRSVSGADARNAKRKLTTKDIAGAHLALAYGWLPTLSDVAAAAEAYEVLTQKPRVSRVTASRRVVNQVEGSQSPTLYTCPGTKVSSKRITYVMTEQISALRTLGLYDPLSVAWEVVPWSFVADWFVPIGTYLSVLGTIPHLSGEFLTQTRVHYKTVCDARGHPSYEGGFNKRSELAYTRGKQTSLSVPLPTFRGFDQLYNNGKRVANAAALIRQLYK
jgi:hypothetical protein